MNYQSIRSEIKSGDLIAFRGEGFISKLICHVTGGAHSHVGIAWRFRGRLFILEAKEGRGVTLRALSQCIPFDWIEIDSKGWNDEIEQIALSELGLSYSYSDALLAGIGLNFRGKGKICSEYVRDIYRQLFRITNLHEFNKLTTPKDMVSFALNLGFPLRAVRK